MPTFPYTITDGKLSFHPWALENCKGVGKESEPSDEDVRRYVLLAKRIARELVNLPYYSSYIDELVREARNLSKKPT